MTDQQALAKYAQHRDPQAFKHMVSVYERLVYSAARRQLANSHDVEDVVQQTFLSLANSSHSIREDLGSWLYATGLNKAADFIRKDHTRRRHEALAPPPAPCDPQSQIMRQEEWQTLSPKIDTAILALPPDQRMLVIQHYFQNRSERELATLLKVNRSTVHRRLTAAIDSLRQALRAAGHLPAAPTVIALLPALSQAPVPAPLSAQLTKIGLAGEGGAGGIAKSGFTLKSILLLKSKAVLVAASIFVAALIVILGYIKLKGSTVKTLPSSPRIASASAPAPRALRALRTPAQPGLEPLEPRALLSASWSTTDTYLAAGLVTGMAADNAGNIYMSGTRADPTLGNIDFLREKASGSNAWTTVYQTPAPVAGTTRNMLAIDAAGDLFWAGAATNGDWIVREQRAGQSGFTIIDDLPKATCSAIALDSAGDIYAVGRAMLTTTTRGKTTTASYDIVRKLTPSSNGNTFTAAIVYQALSTSFTVSSVGVITGGPAAGVYALGLTSGGWTVLKSADAGQTWTQVDQFNFGSNTSAQPFAIAGDNAGNVYVAGSATEPTITGYDSRGRPVYTNISHWLVRECTNGGTSWTTADDFDLASPKPASASAIGADLAGNIYVVGTAYDAQGLEHGIIRTNAGGAWTTSDDNASGVNIRNLAITTAPDGTVYTAGRAGVGAGQNYFIRALPAAPALLKASLDPVSPSTTIDLSWVNPAASDVTAIGVYRSTNGVDFTLIASLAPSSSIYSDIGLSPNTTYSYYLVNVLNADGSSAQTATVQLTTLS